MKRRIFGVSAGSAVCGFLALLIVGLWVSGPARAGDIYKVEGISIDATAASATEARGIAVAEGQKQALERLLRRLAQQSEWPQLPQVDQALAESMVRSFQVANEKRSETRYLADLTVSFNPASVRSLLNARSIPFAESQARPALLVPVLTDESGDRLWDEGNAWTGAWALTDTDNILTPFIIPLGDIGDMTGLSVEQALSGDRPALQAMAERYGADRVIVAHAQIGQTPDSLTARYVLYPNGEAGPRSWSGRQSGAGTLETAAYRLATAFVNELGEDWKQESIVRFAERAVLSASVPYQSLQEWQTVRIRLGQIPLIKGVTIVGLSVEGAQVELDYVGTIDTLELSLQQQNLALTELDGYWYLAAIR